MLEMPFQRPQIPGDMPRIPYKCDAPLTFRQSWIRPCIGTVNASVFLIIYNA